MFIGTEKGLICTHAIYSLGNPAYEGQCVFWTYSEIKESACKDTLRATLRAFNLLDETFEEAYNIVVEHNKKVKFGKTYGKSTNL